MSVTSYLNNLGFYMFEGYTQQISQQVEDLIDLMDFQLQKKTNINIMEIGFNAGHSAEIFLKHDNNLTLTSFDLGTHDYVKYAKEYIDITYPNRHKLIVGDSRDTIPIYSQLKDTKFDIIFIDGGHDYEIATNDMKNCFHLAHEDTIVILDDTMFTPSWKQNWTIGPTKTWMEHLEQHKIIELNRKDYSNGRGMSWGKYVF